jgi:type II secretory pathway component GspD/PulD (secretin)
MRRRETSSGWCGAAAFAAGLLLPGLAAAQIVSPPGPPSMTPGPRPPLPGGTAPTRPAPLQPGQAVPPPAAPAMNPPLPAASPEAHEGQERVNLSRGITEAPRGKVYVNYSDTEIVDVIKAIANLTKKNFVFDERVRGKITIIARQPISVAEAYETFISALEMKNFTVVRSGKMHKIVPIADAKMMAIDTYGVGEAAPKAAAPAAASPAAPAAAAVDPPKVTYNFQNASLPEVLRWLGKATGKRFVFAEDLDRFRVTLASQGPVAPEEAYLAFATYLQMNIACEIKPPEPGSGFHRVLCHR